MKYNVNIVGKHSNAVEENVLLFFQKNKEDVYAEHFYSFLFYLYILII